MLVGSRWGLDCGRGFPLQRTSAAMEIHQTRSLADFTGLASPHKVGFASAARHLIGLLSGKRQCKESHATIILLTKRLTFTQLGCTSRHEVHWTLKV